MALDLEEQEQLDQLKAFWRRYGSWISALALALALGYAAWLGYRYWQAQQSERAAEVFYDLSLARQRREAPKMEAAWKRLREDYASTAWAQHAALTLASHRAEAGNLAGAKEPLQWLLAQKDRYGLHPSARLRLATVQMEEKQYDAALTTLQTSMPQAFEGLLENLRSSIYQAQGKPQQVQASLRRAYQAMERSDPLRGVVAMRLSDLGIDPTTLDTPPPRQDATP